MGLDSKLNVDYTGSLVTAASEKAKQEREQTEMRLKVEAYEK